MEVYNNFSPLAFRRKESKATYEKWYAFGKNYAIPASANTLTPFQFTELNIPVFDPDTTEVEVINEETGEPKKTGVYVSFDVMPEHGGVLYVSPGKNSFSEALPQGTYRARFSIGDEVYISTPFCVIPGIETSSKYLLIEYWNDEKIAYPDGFITTGANNDFRYQMYVPATICKPKYEFEEELTKRAGYKFLELQTSTKVYAFTFVAPEFICDAMRLIRLSDYIRISHDGEYYNALNFEFDVDWQEQLYLAAVDCQFETDSIIQKLPSFNRRDKASFYNALLANIDTPIMFSPDTVGLYYKEYRETEPVVKGKLIRELSPIDLIDENTTIAVDLGTGEARKFNLYRMLQDYISKSHEDATNFLLHLRGGATFGDDISGSAAHINSAGDAKFNDVDADSVSADAVDVGSWLSVGNTSFTVSKSGKTDTGEFTARGEAYLTEDVYTGGGTGTITKDGQLKYLSAIIQQFLSSPTFVSGFLGEGFKIWVENGNWHIECDNLTVRQTMNIFELLIQKIRSVNGALVVSQSNGKLSEVKEVGEQYKLTTGEEFPTFQEGDLVRCQTFAGYQGSGLTFDFTQFAKFYYSGSSFDSSLVDVTPDSISFNLNDTGNSGFAFYKMQPSSETPIEIPSFILILEGAYPGMMAVSTGLDSNDRPVESAGVLLKNGENLIPAITLSQGIHNFAIIVVGDSGHGTGKVTVKQKRADGSAPSNNFVKFYWVEVKSVDGTSFFVDKSEFNGVVPAVGDEVVQMGNTKNPERQALIYITAQESGQPYIEILKGVNSKTLAGTNRTRLGDLNNIQDSAFPVDYQPHGSGLYSDNVWLKGIFLLRNNQTIEDYVKEKDDALKDYLDTEITAIPGKIELAVRSLKTANYNLLLDSNHTLIANPYQLGAYKYDVHLVKGKSYTLTVCYKCADSDNIYAYNNPSFGYLASLPKSAEETIVSTKITPSQDDAAYFYFYKVPQKETTQTYVRWAVITEGDIGVAAWIPSRTEVRTGIRNLFPISRMQTATNKQLNYFDITGWVATVYSEEEFKSRFKPSTKYTITGRYTMLGKPTAGTGYKDSSLAFCLWNNTNLIDLWRKNVENEAVGTSGDILNTFTTPSNLDGYRIIVYTMYDSGNVGEFRFTDLMVSEGIEAVGWTQAPEDIEYDYRKYTDTQILAVDGKIELSVKTQLEKTTIGGNNLIDGSKDYWFNQSDHLWNVSLNYNPASNGWMSVLGSGAFNCYKQWMNVDKTAITPGKQYTLGIDVSIGGNYIHEAGLFFNIRYYEGSTAKLVAYKTINLTNDTKWTRYYVTLELPSVLPSGITVNDLFFLCGFTGNNTGAGAGLIVSYKNINLVEGGIGTSWSPSANDTYGKSVEYTNQQISVVEGKISLEVSKEIQNTQFGGNNLYSYTSSPLNQMSSEPMTITRLISEHGFHLVGAADGRSNVRIHNIIPPIPGRYTVSGWIKGSQSTTPGITIDVCGSATYRVLATPDNNWSFFKHTFDVTNNTEEQSGIYNFVDLQYISWAYIWVKDFKVEFGDVATAWSPNEQDPVYKSAEYTNGQIDITNRSITAAVTRISSAENRLTSAELKLTDTSAKLTVVEGKADGAQSTANSANSAAGAAQSTANAANSLAGAAQSTANAANSLAGTANNKADATNNGLVETGINITSRKIVLKSDNVLFQNNAGQQTAAINANGKLTANAIEVGEVVAGGFAAQRITTGNLTVTDGAVIGGMAITGGVLTGKNINIQDGAKIGSFTIVSGIFSAQNTPAGIQMTLSNNAATFDSSGVRVEHNSGGYALTTTGNGRVFLTGSDFWVQCKDVDFMGVQTWKAPGVFYACTILGSGAIGATWGNPDFHITRVVLNSTGRYTVYTSGGQVGNYFVMVQGYDPSLWLSTTVEPYSPGEFTYKVFDVNNGMKNASVIIYFCGMVS
ncbi:hypothetical protein BF344P1_00061 [Bacteroides phage BF344P1]|nr:hypothetical protein BF344P1_00061 [Bacteroides phage BF344P1]